MHDSDSLKLTSALFIEKNLSGQFSECPVFIKPGSTKYTDIGLDTITSEKSLATILNTFKLRSKTLQLPDSLLVTTDLIEDQIERSTELYNKYAWNQQVPKDIFLHYLLPYKIYGEHPDPWLRYLSNHYDSVIQARKKEMVRDSLNERLMDPAELYYSILVNHIADLFNYNEDYLQLCDYPSFYELVASKKGACLRSAYLNTYILRSIGLPATVDVVPLWGSRNGSHAIEVYWNCRQQKFITGPGRQLERPAKVFRLSFANTNFWTDSIRPYVKEDKFYLNNLKNDHFMDVTGDHNKTSDIHISIGNNLPVSTFAYLCVYNYGEWVPVFWGKIDSTGKAIFRKMGTNVLYRLAIPTGDTLQYSKMMFALDTTGSLKYFAPAKHKTITMKLSKLNSGKDMWVKKGVGYSLLYLDSASQWKVRSGKTCPHDSVILFYQVPQNTLYRLVKTNGDKRLERIFSYTPEGQTWW